MTQLFNFLKTIDFDDNIQIEKNFFLLTFSVFDHFLSIDEYSNAPVMCYRDVINDLEKEKIYDVFEKKFINFYKILYEFYASKITLIIDEKEKKISGPDEYMKNILNGIRENPRCGIILSELGIYILTGYDLTHDIFIKKENSEIIHKIKELVQSSGLFLI